MKRFALLLSIGLMIMSCKKDKNQIDPSAPLSDRLPGTWEITAVNYSGMLPDQQNPNQGTPFAGEGENVSGYFQFDSDTNTGAFDINFIAKIDIGLGQPLAVTVNQGQSGLWEPTDQDAYVKMWSNDTITNWKVITNLSTSQVWRTSIVLDYGAGLDSIPVQVQAAMTKK